MSYRNPLEAAMARAAALEGKLQKLEAASEQEVAQLERERDLALAEVARLRERISVGQGAPKDKEPSAEEAVRSSFSAPPQSHRPNQPRRTAWILRVLYGALLIGLAWTLALLLVPISAWFWLLIVALVLGGWVLNWWMHPPSYITLPIAALLVTSPIACEPELTSIAFFGHEVPQIQLDQAPSFKGELVRLPQSRVDLSRKIDGSWVESYSESSEQIYAELAPIVTRQSDDSTPVTAWAVCRDGQLERVKACTEAWKVAFQGGTILKVSDGLRWTIEKKGQPLPASGFPLCVSWEDPLAVVRSHRSYSLLWLLGVILVWSVVYSWAAHPED